MDNSPNNTQQNDMPQNEKLTTKDKIIGVIFALIIISFLVNLCSSDEKEDGNTESSKIETACDNGDNRACKKLCENGNAKACESVCETEFFVNLKACKLACGNGSLTACTKACCTKACIEHDADACKKACSGGDEDACNIANEMACNNGDNEACQKACHSGVRESCKKLCDSGDAEACEDLRGYRPDDAPFGADNAIAYFKKWCDKGKHDACNEAGRMVLNNNMNKKLAFEFYEKGCKLDADSASCANLCAMYNNGDGVKKDSNKAFECYLDICNKNNQYSGHSCRKVAKTYYNKKDEAKAFEFYKKGCENRDGESCYHCALYYEAGNGVRQSNEMAKNYYRRACKNGYQEGCSAAKN